MNYTHYEEPGMQGVKFWQDFEERQHKAGRIQNIVAGSGWTTTYSIATAARCFHPSFENEVFTYA